ncbi:uncharacterized protein UTRI_10426 [Ustilago trichophora]|uniref:Effector family protein Eff1 n=1 Tax=Ustilago trichophora TaxID=86804 RepID=A0A5C3EDS0_9BASI|nr:uncharacterized protein UTRI_10426 [Ustilago trichophora]
MVALPHRGILQYLFVTFALLTLAFAVDDGPPLSVEDLRMYRMASPVGYMTKMYAWGDERLEASLRENLNHYRDRYDNDKAQSHQFSPETTLTFVQDLHNQAKEGPGVMVWEDPEASSSKSILSWLKPKSRAKRPIYYSSVITPESSLGQRGGLQPTEKHPYGKVAFAFWKYDKGHVQLFRMNTFILQGRPKDWNLRKLNEVIPIPLKQVIKVH